MKPRAMDMPPPVPTALCYACVHGWWSEGESVVGPADTKKNRGPAVTRTTVISLDNACKTYRAAVGMDFNPHTHPISTENLWESPQNPHTNITGSPKPSAIRNLNQVMSLITTTGKIK